MSTYENFNDGMGFVPGVAVTPAMLVTNVPASTLLAWAAGTTYALDAEIIDVNGVIWRSMAAGNVGNDPATTTGKWQKRGVENRLRAFDASLGSATENVELIELKITPGAVVTDVLLFGVEAHTVQVLMEDPIDEAVFDSDVRVMVRPSGNSHWGYFFTPLERESKLHISGLPAYTQATITIRIANPGGTARVAEIVMGRSIWLGNTQWRASIGFDDWSEKKRDDWGGWIAEQGAYSDRLKLQVLVKGTQYERVREQIIPYRAKPVVWIGAKGFNALTTYGYITGFEQVLAARGFSDCSMTIEGLES